MPARPQPAAMTADEFRAILDAAGLNRKRGELGSASHRHTEPGETNTGQESLPGPLVFPTFGGPEFRRTPTRRGECRAATVTYRSLAPPRDSPAGIGPREQGHGKPTERSTQDG